ncbi:MAG TPA: asparagine synthase (glutamine-hydrolyzing) [Longimicrobiales bacterium]
MCGIVGILAFQDELSASDVAVLPRMADAIAHRGPDGEGYALIASRTGQIHRYASKDSPAEIRARFPDVRAAQPGPGIDLGLAHRRFSIIDLSSAAHQPFTDADGRVCLVFNGEIYNYLELRRELEDFGHRFRTASDTEVVVAAFRQWRLGCFSRFNGMWAIALYDAEHCELVLSRDRHGQRPLYLAEANGRLIFGSEIKALLLHPAVADTVAVEEDKILDYLRYGWRDLDDRTFYKGIRCLAPGTSLVIRSGGQRRTERYWRLPTSRDEAPARRPLRESQMELRALLTDAIALRLRADVPVAFELSGGLDSSSLVALASTAGHRVHAYTVAFRDPRWDESAYARRVAARHRLDHRTILPDLDSFWSDADQFVALQEEPFHSVNLHTNQSLRRRIRCDGFKVLVAGSAGDELFAGYDEYLFAYLHSLLRGRRSPHALMECARILARLVPAVARHYRRRIVADPRALLHAGRRVSRSRPATAPDPIERWVQPNLASTPHAGQGPPHRDLHRLLIANMTRFKMPYWLASGDKANMGIPLEPRVPFLDHRVVEFAFRLPLDHLIRGGWTKWLLRKTVEDVLPRSVTWRRVKMGFPFPLARWLAESHANVAAIFRTMDNPYLRQGPILEDQQRLCAVDPALLWRILSLELWHRRMIRGVRIGSQ